ncbi:MAG: alpha/beta fold hydrolase [Acidimicrobiales bacterium]
MTLAGELTIGHVAGPPANERDPVAVLLHGFTQNRHCWGHFATRLGTRFTVLGIDLPGHGDSGAAGVSFHEATRLIGATLDSLERTVDTLIGYSMGGRMALQLTIDRPEVCSALAMVGATAGLADPRDRESRRTADAALAQRLRSEGPERFLDFWLGLPLFVGLTDNEQFRTERLSHWGSGVAETLEYRGTGNMEPLWSRLSEIEVPVLALAGDQDEKFTELGQALAAGIGDNGSFGLIGESGHACHLQRPVDTANAIMRWRFGS